MIKRKFTWAFTIATGISVLSLFTGGIMKSAGGPPYNTGAPNEKTCSGPEGGAPCHGTMDGGNDNWGPGTPSIVFGGGINYYVPGQTYTVKPTISHPTRNRFGFQIVALKDQNNANVGTINLTDTMRMRMQSPTWGCCQDRWYVMHKYDGSFPQTPNLGEWTFNWTAPSADEGPVTFYAAFLAANNNALNDTADQVYTTSLTISPSATGVRKSKLFEASVNVWPNPANDALFVSYVLSSPSMVTVTLSDLKGGFSRQLFSGNRAAGMHRHYLQPAGDLAAGVYLLTVKTDREKAFLKVVLND